MRITLCGSTRFKDAFIDWNHRLACAGHTVYSLSAFGREANDVGKDDMPLLTDAEKITLDLVHLDKIMNSEAIVVINPDGYVGFSTRREIQWASMQSKLIFWIEDMYPYGLTMADTLLSPKEFMLIEPSSLPPPAPPSTEPLVPRRGVIPLDDDIPF